jgi:Fic family protein
MHRTLLEKSDPDIVGRLRDDQVWIGGGSISPHNATFVPPHHERAPELMSDVIAFVRRTDVPVLAQVAIAHAQFETIHPFPTEMGGRGERWCKGCCVPAGSRGM